VTAPGAAPAGEPDVAVAEAQLMGGRVGVHLRPREASGLAAAERDGGLLLRRIRAWADRLTRFSPTSDLGRLNADPRPASPMRPTLAAVVDWGRAAESLSDGIVNIALLAERLAAEGLAPEGLTSVEAGLPERSWSLERGHRGSVMHRPAGLRFDLDGVAKGWLADRALGLLHGYTAAVVDADGDIAIRLDPAQRWRLGVADPRQPGLDLAVLELSGHDRSVPAAFGLATSGTSIHRWLRGDGVGSASVRGGCCTA
jgi:thiamine biosynthesis lipoprotein